MRNRTAKRSLHGGVAGVLLVFVAASVLCGCDKIRATREKRLAPRPPDKIRVEEMADRLELMLESRCPYSARLADGLNSVMIFADPQGQAYVNGRAVGPSGGVVAWGQSLLVPGSLEPKIRAALRRPKPVKIRLNIRLVRPLPPRPRVRLGPVVIDPGHGGVDPGAIGVNGLREKDVNLDVSLRVRDILRARGVDVRMTRSDDRFVPLNDRAALAGRLGASVFVSLHADAAKNGSARGFTVYGPKHRMEQARVLGGAMVRHLLGAGLPSRGYRPPPGNGTFRVLRRTECLAVLVEMGYLSNARDAELLGRREFRRRLADLIAEVIFVHLTK